MRQLRLNEIPTWFRLENYAGAGSLDAKGWARQLHIRFHAKRVLETLGKDAFVEFFQPVLDHGLPDMPFDVQNNSVRLDAMEGVPVAYSVYPMRFADARWLWESMEEVGASPGYPCDAVLSRADPYGLSNFAHLIVDLTASDDQIRDDFGKWLAKHRELLGPPGRDLKFERRHFDKWISDNLLPFIDLTLWANSVDRNISHRLMGQILSAVDDDRDIELRDRRTVAKNADWLLQWPIISALHAQGNQERR